MVLHKAADPEVDIVHAAVEREEFGLEGGVAGDLGEGFHFRETVGGAGGVVVGKAMVAPALDIQRGEVESARSGRAEEEVAQPPDELGINFLGFVRGEVFQ